MWLMGKGKMRGTSIKHPLGGDKYPTRLEEVELAELTKRLRSGDSTVVQRLWDGHMRLAFSIASRYARNIPQKAHDIVSEAFHGIAYAIKFAPEKLVDDNITAWISTCIHRFVADFIEKDHLIPVSRRTANRKIEEGEPIVFPTIVGDAALDGDNTTILRQTGSKAAEASLQIAKEMAIVENIIETVDDIISQEPVMERKELKRTVFQLRAAGYNDGEIGEILGISLTFVNKLRNEVRRKYEEVV